MLKVVEETIHVGSNLLNIEFNKFLSRLIEPNP